MSEGKLHVDVAPVLADQHNSLPHWRGVMKWMSELMVTAYTWRNISKISKAVGEKSLV